MKNAIKGLFQDRVLEFYWKKSFFPIFQDAFPGLVAILLISLNCLVRDLAKKKPAKWMASEMNGE